MRFPNLRYGNPEELRYYTMLHPDPIPYLAKRLRRSERSVRDWLSGAARVPWWVPEILRLQKAESELIYFQMTGRKILARHGLVAPEALVLPFAPAVPEMEKPSVVAIQAAAIEDARLFALPKWA